jgi:hypothetical protein
MVLMPAKGRRWRPPVPSFRTYLVSAPAVVDFMAKEVFCDLGISVDQDGKDNEDHHVFSARMITARRT